MAVLNLASTVPFIDVQLGDKQYKVYANDDNIRIASQIVGMSNDFQRQVADLEDSGREDIEPKVTKMMSELKNALTEALDQLLEEEGVGEKLWTASHGSSEAVARAIGQIQEALKREREKQAKDEQNKLNELFPAAKPKRGKKNVKPLNTK